MVISALGLHWMIVCFLRRHENLRWILIDSPRSNRRIKVESTLKEPHDLGRFAMLLFVTSECYFVLTICQRWVLVCWSI